tara:strand:+ start:280 stop:1167 length:888 start_codon:yes stop_codon:yes gene_type:complete
MKIKTYSPFKIFLDKFFSNYFAVFGLILCIVLIFIAIFANYISPQNPYDLMQLNILEGRLPPGSESTYNDLIFYLGTDDQGRDILSAIFYGLRTSFIVAVSSAIVALLIGCSLGLFSAYVGGRFDDLVMRIVDIQLSFPPVLIALILLALFGQGLDKIIIALIVTQWAYYARTIRSTCIVEQNKEYVEAAKCLQFSQNRILFVHILPNCMPPLIIVVTMRVAYSIMLEATLSFLGLGLPITEPSLGLLIANGFEYMLSGLYWISFFPGIALLITIVAINLVGDHLRDILNPRLEK